MAVRNILNKSDETLHKVCRPVEKFDEKLWTWLDDMKETLAQANGVGLAAPQVAILRRFCIIDVGDGNVYELINPEITWKSEETQSPLRFNSLTGRFPLSISDTHEHSQHTYKYKNLFHDITHKLSMWTNLIIPIQFY